MGQNATRISPPAVSVAREVIEPNFQKRPPHMMGMLAQEASILSLLLWILEDSKKVLLREAILYHVHKLESKRCHFFFSNWYNHARTGRTIACHNITLWAYLSQPLIKDIHKRLSLMKKTQYHMLQVM